MENRTLTAINQRSNAQKERSHFLQTHQNRESPVDIDIIHHQGKLIGGGNDLANINAFPGDALEDIVIDSRDFSVFGGELNGNGSEVFGKRNLLFLMKTPVHHVLQ